MTESKPFLKLKFFISFQFLLFRIRSTMLSYPIELDHLVSFFFLIPTRLNIFLRKNKFFEKILPYNAPSKFSNSDKVTLKENKDYENAQSLVAEIVDKTIALAVQNSRRWEKTPFDEQAFILTSINIASELTHALECIRYKHLKAGFWNLRSVIESCSALIVINSDLKRRKQYFQEQIFANNCISQATKILPEFGQLYSHISRNIVHEDARHHARVISFEVDLKENQKFQETYYHELIYTTAWAALICNQALEIYSGYDGDRFYTSKDGALTRTSHHILLNIDLKKDLLKQTKKSQIGFNLLEKIDKFRIIKIAENELAFKNYSTRPSLIWLEYAQVMVKVANKTREVPVICGLHNNIVMDLCEALHSLQTGHNKNAGMLLRGVVEQICVLDLIASKKKYYLRYLEGNLDVTTAPHLSNANMPGIKDIYKFLSDKFVHEHVNSLGRNIFDPKDDKFIYGSIYPSINHRSGILTVTLYKLFIVVTSYAAFVQEPYVLESNEIGVFIKKIDDKVVFREDAKVNGYMTRFQQDFEKLVQDTPETLKTMKDYYKEWLEEEKDNL